LYDRQTPRDAAGGGESLDQESLGITGETHSFSYKWTLAAVVVYTAMEIGIAIFLAPAIFAGRLASPMLQMRLQMIMHLGSFFLGGIVVGVLSPGVRLVEPALGAFLAVAIVFTMSFFMPTWFHHWSTNKVLIGGGIALVLGLLGAWTGEKWMGNISPDDDNRRGRLRRSMWGDEGMLVPRGGRHVTRS
jgi:hypothetical protein